MMIWWCYYEAGGSVDAVDADARCVEGNGWDGSLFNHMQMVLVVAALAIISTITNDDLEQEDFDDWLTLVAHSTSVETIRREDVYLIKKYFTFQKLAK